MTQGDRETALKLGLTSSEYDRIIELIGRAPNFEELSMFSVMWSEHCSYKNSIIWLKTLPKSGPQMLVEAGEENAGLVDIGDGLACAFKIESHNHPSAIEPYQGAATGVGGIHRDIFTLGARPIAALNALRFGDISRDHTKHLVKGVVKGIGDYGNCFGVPTIGGETTFLSCYNQNILVNAMSVGIVEIGKTVSATAAGSGNPVLIVGSATGKDGIHGATFASADLHENSSDDLPSVQVGDPFQEKLLLEASLEAIHTGAIVGMQDMGAAGITCSTSEMSEKGSVGMHINLDLVPTRQKDMKAFEILLSESQERMLIVAKKGREDEIIQIFEKWDVPCKIIGEVIEDPQLKFYSNGRKIAEIPAEALVLGGGAPVYEREYKEPSYLNEIAKFDIDSIPEPQNCVDLFHKILRAPNICSKRYITDQYDKTVRGNTITDNQAADAAVVRIKGTQKALALSIDCNPAYVYADPYQGTMMAVAEAARNVVCSGAKPLAITNCLNFGNPYHPEAYFQFVQAIKGMSTACKALETPVTGGNVSFYNHSEIAGKQIPVYPTPSIGMLGLISENSQFTGLSWQEEGEIIYILGKTINDLGSSEYLRFIHNIEHSPCPSFDMNDEILLQKTIFELTSSCLLSSCHDVSNGGLLVTLFESALENYLGCEISLDSNNIRQDALLFGEGGSRAVISIHKDNEPKFLEILTEYKLPYSRLGHVGGDSLIVNGENFGVVKELSEIFNQSLEKYLEDK